MNTTTNTTATARRITVKGKPAVEITNENGTIEIMKGARAERAEAVLIVAYRDAEPTAYGLRGDFAKAQTEAHGLAHLNAAAQRKGWTAARVAYAIRIAD